MRYFLKQEGTAIYYKAVGKDKKVEFNIYKGVYSPIEINESDPDNEADGVVEITRNVFMVSFSEAREAERVRIDDVELIMKGGGNA